MRKNTAATVGPVPFYDNNGNLLSAQTFAGAGETAMWDSDTLAFADTASNATEAATTGMYYVPLTAAELNHNNFVIVRLRKATYADQFFVVPIDPVDLLFNDPNHVIDQFTYDPTTGMLTAARKRIFSSAALTSAATTGAANDADGEIARYLLTAVENGEALAHPARVQWVRDL